MKNLWKFAAVALGPGAILFFMLVGYAAVDAYILGNCDPKFGCAFRVKISAFVSTLVWLCSFAGHLPACLVFRNTVRHLPARLLLAAVFVLGLGQGALLASSDSLLPGNSPAGMIGAWSGISALFALVTLAVAHRWSSSNSFKANPRHVGARAPATGSIQASGPAPMRMECTRHIDASEPDADGCYEYHYEYDIYRFSDGATCFVARSYTHTLDEAHFLRIELDGDPRLLTETDLAHPLFFAARAHLLAAGKMRLNWLSGRGNGYEPIPSVPPQGP